MNNDTHSKTLGYLLWIFGFTGAHRFYYGKPVTGTIWFFTLGLLGIGWIIDLFLIPSMDRQADARFVGGEVNYSVAWLLLTFLGLFGVHRMYIGKWISGIVYLFTGGFFLLGVLYDFWTLNAQISERNHGARQDDAAAHGRRYSSSGPSVALGGQVDGVQLVLALHRFPVLDFIPGAPAAGTDFVLELAQGDAGLLTSFPNFTSRLNTSQA
jgi:TM2 domain-containing membrane protein YozV